MQHKKNEIRVKEIVDCMASIVEENIALRKKYANKPLAEEELRDAVQTFILFYSNSLEEIEKLHTVLNNLCCLSRMEREEFPKLIEIINDTKQEYQQNLNAMTSPNFINVRKEVPDDFFEKGQHNGL